MRLMSQTRRGLASKEIVFCIHQSTALTFLPNVFPCRYAAPISVDVEYTRGKEIVVRKGKDGQVTNNLV